MLSPKEIEILLKTVNSLKTTKTLAVDLSDEILNIYFKSSRYKKIKKEEDDFRKNLLLTLNSINENLIKLNENKTIKSVI